MNYRHVFHAGNFADVLKHVVVARIVEYLKGKDKPFRVIDTHAGPGFYDLSSAEAQKTGEWRDGVGRLLDCAFPPEVEALLAPWREVIAAYNPAGDFRFYPGSPTIVRRLLRSRDRLTAIEKHPADAFALKTRFAGDWQARIIELDGWLALGAHLPPKEKRGLVLVDPPFEEDGEFDRLAEGLATAHRRWPGGTYALWYPVKHLDDVRAYRDRLVESGIPDIVDIALTVRRQGPEPRLTGCGITIVNPPYTLEAQLRVILPELSVVLGEDGARRWAVDRLAAEAR